jgi:Rhomboid family
MASSAERPFRSFAPEATRSTRLGRRTSTCSTRLRSRVAFLYPTEGRVDDNTPLGSVPEHLHSALAAGGRLPVSRPRVVVASFCASASSTVPERSERLGGTGALDETSATDFITWFELPASIVLLAWFALHLFSGVGQLGTHVSGGVAYWAHVGGFAFGALLRGCSTGGGLYGVPPRPDDY